MGKGSRPRPYSVSQNEFGNNYDAIFGKKDTMQVRVEEDKGKILYVKTFNLQKTNIIEKGIGILAIEYQFLSAIKKYYSNVYSFTSS